MGWGGQKAPYNIVIAASNTPTNEAALADYVCDGTADQTEINTAITDLNTLGGGSIMLLPGTYTITAAIDFTPLVDGSSQKEWMRFNARNAYIVAGGNLTSMVDMAPGATGFLQLLDIDIGALDGAKASYTVTQGVLMHRASNNFIRIGKIMHMSGIGFNSTQSGVADVGCFNNHITIGSIRECTGTAFNVTSDTDAYNFQGNIVTVGQVWDNGNGFIIGDATDDNARWNTFILGPCESNAGYGIYDYCGANTWIVNYLNNNTTADIDTPSNLSFPSTFICDVASGSIGSNALGVNFIQSRGSFEGLVQFAEQSSAPATPASGYGRLYEKTDGMAYFKNDAGTEHLAAGDIGARVYDASSQTIPNTTWTALNFDSERYDTSAFHDNSTNNTRLTIPAGQGGKYLIMAHVHMLSDAGGAARFLGIRLGGSTFIAVTKFDVGAGGEAGMSISTIYELAATNYVEACIYQDSGGDLGTAQAANFSPEFMIQRIG